MNTVALWLLIASGSGSGYVPVVVDRFVSLPDCKAAAAAMEQATGDRPGMRTMYGVCIPAKVYKP